MLSFVTVTDPSEPCVGAAHRIHKVTHDTGLTWEAIQGRGRGIETALSGGKKGEGEKEEDIAHAQENVRREATVGMCCLSAASDGVSCCRRAPWVPMKMPDC